jgi:hypothetical protein
MSGPHMSVQTPPMLQRPQAQRPSGYVHVPWTGHAPPAPASNAAGHSTGFPLHDGSGASTYHAKLWMPSGEAHVATVMQRGSLPYPQGHMLAHEAPASGGVSGHPGARRASTPLPASEAAMPESMPTSGAGFVLLQPATARDAIIRANEDLHGMSLLHANVGPTGAHATNGASGPKRVAFGPAKRPGFPEEEALRQPDDLRRARGDRGDEHGRCCGLALADAAG